MDGKLNRRRLLGLSALVPAVAIGLKEAAIAPVAHASPLPLTPVLPQNDPLPWGRQALLAYKQSQYIWTEQTPFLEGVPTAYGFPPEAFPTIEWLLTALDGLITLGVNLLGNVIPQIVADTTGRLADNRNRLTDLKNQTEAERRRFNGLGGGKYNQLGERPNDAYVDAAPEDMAVAALIQTALLNLFGQVQIVIANARLNLQELLSANYNLGEFGTQDGLARYNAMWATMPIPELAVNLHDDEIFAYLRVGGSNTNVIERVRGQLPAKFPLTNAQFQQAYGVAGDSLPTAIAEGRLYICDYAELGKMAPDRATYKVLTGEGYNSAPIAVFVVPPGKREIQALAIQCGQDPASNPMFVRPAPDDQARFWSWQMAKTVVQTADFNHHEMLAHLGRAHLVSEVFAVATQRTLAPNHPLNMLLVPHFEGDIFINFLAATIILPPNFFADVILAAPLGDIKETVGKDRLEWDFYERMPRKDFANRGVDDVAALEFPYRDDGLLIWDTIHGWVDEYIRAYYATDADVAGDPELAAWADELLNIGKLKGFRRVTSIDQLVEVVTMAAYTASAYHASVNYPQSHLLTYAPFAAGINQAPPPTTTTGHTQADWIKMLPTVFTALAQFYFLHILATVYYRPLGDYRTNVFPFPPAITDPRVAGPGGPLDRFRAGLEQAEAEINRRNQVRSHPYEYLLPSNIPTSTNI